ncbi:hypothetical protein PSTG_10419 [Puccinia striiformis f. sp. tritici PST-78]|uniref:Uncharacterized protein n=1 Tax=Puccinia striiformis f. sp. tritici PST-78 TaxID=1165861 RepID=A0A0L0VAH8_9BASI|nr:hypothetical protein PSTG_10419 [Puccinia striiformis f. sp. tritici PST-78]
MMRAMWGLLTKKIQTIQIYSLSMILITLATKTKAINIQPWPMGCKESLAKFCSVAKKLKYLPNSKAEFIEICIEKECKTPHKVERDVQTRWNSILIQVNSILRCEASMSALESAQLT